MNSWDKRNADRMGQQHGCPVEEFQTGEVVREALNGGL
jgi:hypothetical protein